jgi:hypothetical protein
MDSSPTRPTFLQRLVGWFVAWQLVFIVAANVLFLVTGGLQGLSLYAEATGQLQGWSLYAPDVPHRAGFVGVELRWPGGKSVKLPGVTEPADREHFFRTPGEGRLLNYELHLRLLLLTWKTPKDDASPATWQKRLEDELRLRGPAMRAYLGWRRDRYLRDNPDTPPPDEVVLWVRMHDIAPPGQSPWSWPPPLEVPRARWRPGHEPGEGYLPLESFDITAWPYTEKTRRFLPVRTEGGS